MALSKDSEASLTPSNTTGLLGCSQGRRGLFVFIYPEHTLRFSYSLLSSVFETVQWLDPQFSDIYMHFSKECQRFGWIFQWILTFVIYLH